MEISPASKAPYSEGSRIWSSLTCLRPHNFLRVLILPDSEKDRLAKTIIPHPFRTFFVRLFVANSRIDSLLGRFSVSDDDVSGGVEKGFCESIADTAGAPSNQNVFCWYAEIRCCGHTSAREALKNGNREQRS